MKLSKRILSGALAVVTALSLAFVVTPQSAKADNYDTGAPEISSVTITPTGLNGDGKLTKDSTLKFAFHAEDNEEIYSANLMVDLYTPSGDYSESSMKSYYSGSSTTEIVKNGNEYTCDFALSSWDYNGTVKADYIKVSDRAGNVCYYYFKNNTPTYSWDIVGSADAESHSSGSIESATITDFTFTAVDQNGNAVTDGQTFGPNDSVHFTIKFDSSITGTPDTLYARMDTALSDNESYIPVNLTKGTDNTYTGAVFFNDGYYPTLWKLSVPSFNNADNTINYRVDMSNAEGDEIILKVGNQVVLPTTDCTFSIDYYTTDEDGKLECVYDTKNVTIPIYTKGSDLNLSLPVTKDPDGNVCDWHVYTYQFDNSIAQGKYVDLGKLSDYVFKSSSSGSYTLQPYYNGYRIVNITYPVEDDGEYYTKNEDIWVKNGTKDEIAASAVAQIKSKVPSEFGTVYAPQNWLLNEFGNSFITVSTQKVAVNLERCYVASVDGDLDYTYYASKTVWIDRDNPLTADQVVASYDSSAPAKIAGINFLSWNDLRDTAKAEYTAELGNLAAYGKSVINLYLAYANYDKDIYKAYYIHKSGNSNETLGFKLIFADQGASEDTVVAMAKEVTLKGCSDWTYEKERGFVAPYMDEAGWLCLSTTSTPTDTSNDTNTYEAQTKVEEITYEETESGATKVTEKIEIGTDDTLVKDGVTYLNNSAKSAVIDMINSALEETKNLAASKTVATPKVTISMADATVVPTEILEAAKGQDVDVTFEMDGGYSWTINGKNITGDNLKDVNMKVNQNTNNVPASLVKDSLGKDTPSIQINLADHGLFGFTADLRIYVGKEYAGKYANLFYYTNGRLEVQNSHLVDADGYAILTFSHASDYVIAMGEDMTKAATTAANTGDNSPILILLLAILAGVASFTYSAKRKSR